MILDVTPNAPRTLLGSVTKRLLPALLFAAIVVTGFASPTLFANDGEGEGANADPNAPASVDKEGDGSAESAAEEIEPKIQLSFTGANIDTIVSWLAEKRGRTVIKHKDVKCSLTILSPEEVTVDEAVEMIYRALALEGYMVDESPDTILITPEKEAGKIPTEQRVIQLTHAAAAKIKDKLKAVLTKTGKIEVDERANKIIVTDTAKSLKFVMEVIKQLDIQTDQEAITEVIQLRHTEAEAMARLLGGVFGGAAPTKKQAARPQKGKPAPAASSAVNTPVKILPDNGTNRLVISAAVETMPKIRDLIAKLDAAKPQDIAVRTVKLAHVDAREMVREIAPMYSKVRGSSYKETIEISANERSNSLIVLSSQANFDEIDTLVQSLDTPDAGNRSMRTFALKYADADDISEQLEELLDTTPQYNSWRYDPNKDKRDQVRFVPNRRRNEVMAIGTEASLERVAELIQQLDLPIESEDLVPRIYPLKYVGAEDVKGVLDELFLKEDSDRPYWWGDSGDDDNEVGRLYGKVRIAAEPSTNSLIVTSDSSENFDALERILQKLDVRNADAEATLNVPLRYANAVAVSNTINVLFAGPGSPAYAQNRQQQQNNNNNNNRAQANPLGQTSMSFELEEEREDNYFFPWLGNNQGRGPDGRATRQVSDVIGKVRVVPDVRTNSLVMTASPYHLPQVMKLVEQLDRATPQVLIEAKIIEVTFDDKERLGLRWSPDGASQFDSDDFDNSVLATGVGSYLETFLGQNVADAMRTGTVTGAVDLDLLVQFLIRTTDGRVKAEPRLNIADNERGKLFVGSRVPFISGSVNTAEGGRNDTFSYIDVGVILEVTPKINANDEVSLSIRVESSQIREGETLFGGAIIDTRNFRTDMTVKSGDTLVLGGIIQRQESEVIRKLPFLGDIPLLGYFFKKRDTSARDVELMVFLRPVITRNAADVEALMKNELEKASGVREILEGSGMREDEKDEADEG